MISSKQYCNIDILLIILIKLNFHLTVKKNINKKINVSLQEGATTISWLFDKFVMLMVCYFLVTIIHALARNHHRRRAKTSAD